MVTNLFSSVANTTDVVSTRWGWADSPHHRSPTESVMYTTKAKA